VGKVGGVMSINDGVEEKDRAGSRWGDEVDA